MGSLPLEAEHARLGARFADAFGWRLPLDYGDVAKEQRAVRADAGVTDWSARRKTRVTGEDRLAFLDGLLTNDLKPLSEGQGVYAATLDHRGHVHGDLVAYHAGDHYLLETESGAEGRAVDYLEKLLVSDDVTLTDVTAEFAILGLFGPRAGSIAAKMFGKALPVEPYEHRVADVDGAAVRVAANPYFGGIGWEFWIPPNRAAKIFRSVLAAGALPFGTAAADALRIEAGRPKFGVDMDEDTLVLEARLPDAISLTKGCYVGQEIVSRATYVGHVNRLLVGLEFDDSYAPKRGTVVQADGKAVGLVTSGARSAWLEKGIALAYVRRESTEPGTEVTAGGRNGRVAPLPFLRP